MNETKGCLERFINHMSYVVLNLLSPLNTNDVGDTIWTAVMTLIFDSVASVSHLHFETHVSANTSDILVFMHIFVHLQNRCSIRLQPHIHKHTVPRPKFLAKTIQKPIVRWQLACIGVLTAHEQVHYCMRSRIVKLLVEIFFSSVFLLYNFCSFVCRTLIKVYLLSKIR